MHVRTDHVNWHEGVSGPYGDSTGGISNGAAQFSVLSPNTLVMGVGLYAGCIPKSFEAEMTNLIGRHVEECRQVRG